MDRNGTAYSRTSSVQHKYNTFLLLHNFRFASNFFFRFKTKRNKRFSLCFASKRNEINVFSLLFMLLGMDLENWKTDLNIFLSFFTNCPRISLYPFSLWSFCFFTLFSLTFHFFRIRCENKRKSTFFASKRKKFHFYFASKWKWRQFSLLFHFVFASFHFRFASDFYFPHRCEKSEKKFHFRFASFRFEAKMTAYPIPKCLKTVKYYIA
jgi:hypothetical protein